MSDAPVLVTGAAGTAGGAALAALDAAGIPARGFDRVAMPERPEAHRGDLTDRAAIFAALAGCRAVIHLGGTPDRADFVDDLVPNNIVGTTHVLDGCAEHGVRRVVLASTLRVAHRRRSAGPLAANPYHARDHYALSKVVVEELGRLYVHLQELEVIAARIGWLVRNHDEAQRLQRYDAAAIYLSRGDFGRYLLAVLGAEHQGFVAHWVFGPDADRELYSAEDLGAGIGYRPLDAWPDDWLGIDGG